MNAELVKELASEGNILTISFKNGKEYRGVLSKIVADSIVLIVEKGKIVLRLSDEIISLEVQEVSSGIDNDVQSLEDTIIQNGHLTNGSSPNDLLDVIVPITPIFRTEDTDLSDVIVLDAVEDTSSILKIEQESSLEENSLSNNFSPQYNSLLDNGSEIAIQFSPKNIRKQSEILGRLEAQTGRAELELIVPNFQVSSEDSTSWWWKRGRAAWDQIKNQYDNAKKINELASKYGRTPQIAPKLKNLVNDYPDSAFFARHLAYLYFLLEKWDECFALYKATTDLSEKIEDWNNLAVVALKLGKEEIGCYSIERILKESLISQSFSAWNVYLFLIVKLNIYSSFYVLISKKLEKPSNEELKIIAEAVVYILLKQENDYKAGELTQKIIDEQLLADDVLKGLQEFGITPSIHYQNALEELTDIPTPAINIENRPLYQENYILGKIYHYRRDQGFGFLCDEAGLEYFFPRNSVLDDRLLKQLDAGKVNQNVHFEAFSGSKRLSATHISLFQTVEEIYEQANEYAKRGDYNFAIAKIKEVIQRNPEYSYAQELHYEWREKARVIGVPTGPNPFAKAKRAQLIEKNPAEAEKYFRQAISSNDNADSAIKDLASLYAQLERYDEAVKLLEDYKYRVSDRKSLENIRQSILQAKLNSLSTPLINQSSAKLSKFVQYYLDQHTFQGTFLKKAQNKNFSRSDVKDLVRLATESGTRNPRARADFLLSATKVASILNYQEESSKYLCRSLTSKGDEAVFESKDLDTVRSWYCEALSVYNGASGGGREEQDASNSLIRYLFSILNRRDKIPTDPNRQPNVDDTLESVVGTRSLQDTETIFNYITYLISYSSWAAEQLIMKLSVKLSFREKTLNYLKSKGIVEYDIDIRMQDLSHFWQKLRSRVIEETKDLERQLQLLKNLDLSTAWLEDKIGLVRNIGEKFLFQLDKSRLSEIDDLFEKSLDLCRQTAFENREDLCKQIITNCQSLRKDITNEPTKISIEYLLEILKVLQDTVEQNLSQLYASSKPELNLRLAKDSYFPDQNNRIVLQVVVNNKQGRSPAEAVEILIKPDTSLFILENSEIKLNESLRGNDQRTVEIPIKLTDQAKKDRAFSFSMSAEYRTRLGNEQTATISSSVRLYPEDEFEEIENPYAVYAEGNIVAEPEMFFGRGDLIENVSNILQESRKQSKCILIYGQRRAGKSSILHHLSLNLQENKDMLVVDIGNIGRLLNFEAKVSLLYQLLWSIVDNFRNALEEKSALPEYGYLDIQFPITDLEFYNHPNPVQLFDQIFTAFLRQSKKNLIWQDVRIIILIDEFSYLYEYIISGKLQDTFMRNWKAFLQANYFNAALVGQDVMPKFKQRYPNEFGITKDEHVTYLKREDAFKLIDEPIRISTNPDGSRYRERAIERILDLSAGNPYYIQIICNRLVEYMNRKHDIYVTDADVDHVMEDLTIGTNALTEDKFESLYDSGDVSKGYQYVIDTKKVLRSIAVNSKHKLCNLADLKDCKTDSPLGEILDDLVNRHVLDCERAQYYSLKVGLYREWLLVH